ncbi:MAG TPA: hypothetical protein VES67_18605 [Vicinamibacterales bacterium]|nr:hypothetical protein [Vicinamibacterales bacterium]
MKRLYRVSATTAAALAALLFAGTTSAQSKDPIIGKWTMNVAKSKFDPAPGGKSSTVVFTASGTDGVKAVLDGVAGTGDKIHWEYTANHDGKDYPMTGNPEGDMISLKRINANSVETTYKLKGKVTLTNVRTVSADGKTLTVTQKGTNAAGQAVNSVLVFDKA